MFETLGCNWLASCNYIARQPLTSQEMGVTKQDGGRLNGHHCEPAITRKRQRFSKIHESKIAIFSRGDLVRALVVA